MSTKSPTVYDLRKQGHKVRVLHLRQYTCFCNITGIKLTQYAKYDKLRPSPTLLQTDRNYFFHPNGGKTVIEITTISGNDYVGVSVCSDKETYNKKLGVRIALARALKNCNESF